MAHSKVLAIPYGLLFARLGYPRRRGRGLCSCDGRCNSDRADKGHQSAEPAWAAACLQGCHERRQLRLLLGSAGPVA